MPTEKNAKKNNGTMDCMMEHDVPVCSTYLIIPYTWAKRTADQRTSRKRSGIQSIATCARKPPLNGTCCGRRANFTKYQKFGIFYEPGNRIARRRCLNWFDEPISPQWIPVSTFFESKCPMCPCNVDFSNIFRGSSRVQKLLLFDGLKKTSRIVRIEKRELVERHLLQSAFPPNSFGGGGCQCNWPICDPTQIEASIEY